jgi:hypothetical protein
MHPPEATPTVNSSVQTSELQRFILGAKRAIASLQEKVTNTAKESVMSNKLGYFQGTIEPNQGGTKYTPDPMQGKVREEDKFLDAKPTGKVDEMFPGDKEIKEKLQRMADVEERKMFREAALEKAKAKIQKGAYFQGTTEPEIGKTMYKPDPLQMKVREEDKFLEGPKPFPGVGDVDGLFGDDLKEKEQLLRASLKAKFVKAASKAESCWVVFAGEKAVLKMSVHALSNGQPELFYDGIATKKFGENLLTQIKNRGLSSTQQILKSAQEPPPPPPAASPAPPPQHPSGGAPEAPEQVGEQADPAKIVQDLEDLTDEMKAKITELTDGVAGPVGEDMKQLDGVEPAGADAFKSVSANVSSKKLQQMRKTVASKLIEETGSLISKIASQLKENQIAKEIYGSKYNSLSRDQKEYLNELSAEAISDSKSLLKQSNMLTRSASNYAFGVITAEKKMNLVKKAQDENFSTDDFSFEDEDEDENEKEEGENDEDEDKKDYSLFEKPSSDEEPGSELDEEVERLVEKDLAKEFGNHSEEDEEDDLYAKDGKNKEENKEEKVLEEAEERLEVARKELEEAEKDLDLAKKDLEEAEEEEEDEEVEVEEEEKEDEDDLKATFDIDPNKMQITQAGVQLSNLKSKAERTNARIKLAKEGLQSFEHFTDVAHPQGSVEMPGEHEKTQVEAKFHTPEGIKEFMLKLVAITPKVKKAIEQIDTFVREGKLEVKDVDSLVSHGVDAEAVKYWKQFWGQAKDSQANEFAKKLTEPSVNSKSAEDKKIYEAKISRAYDLAYQMVANGSINQNQVQQQASEIMSWNDAAFDTLKRTLSKNKGSTANVVGNIGLLSAGDITLPGKVATASVETTQGADLAQLFDSYFADIGKKY